MQDQKIVFEATPEQIREIIETRAGAFDYGEATNLFAELSEQLRKDRPNATRAEVIVNAVRGAYLAGFAHAYALLIEANEPEGGDSR